MRKLLGSLGLFLLVSLPFGTVRSHDTTQYWMKLKAVDKFQRTIIADTGVSIEAFRDDFVTAIGHLEEKNKLEKLGLVEVAFPMTSAMDFPTQDQAFHNYDELTQELQKLHHDFPNITTLESIGKSFEGREIWVLRISTQNPAPETKPAVIYMGGHHAREHLSVEVPFNFAKYLLEKYQQNDAKTVALIESRDIHIIPAVNPDGLEWDVSGGTYHTWRKSRRPNGDGTYGVDLNRNYGYFWGTGGSSSNTNSETYKGPSAFSEPETQAMKTYIEKHTNITILLTFHTFSELVLYPWGHTYDPITDEKAFKVHDVMAKQMAKWNGYQPMQASNLYIASGDTMDWAWGVQKIFSFTFEMDPASSMGAGGFYPGSKVIDPVTQKNIPACLYLLEYADNPYRVLEPGFHSLPF
jgi:carboxypeptidase T